MENKRIKRAFHRGGHVRVIGFDDTPFDKTKDEKVNISGIVCSKTRFEGMLWGEVTIDGLDGNSVISSMVKNSKFFDQLHAILIDGIGVGGTNILDLQALNIETGLPCIAVMRRKPNMKKMKLVIDKSPHRDVLLENIDKAGEIFERTPFVFQCVGCTPDQAHFILEETTDTGHVPESLRLAHLIGAAICTGQSSNRA